MGRQPRKNQGRALAVTGFADGKAMLAQAAAEGARADPEQLIAQSAAPQGTGGRHVVYERTDEVDDHLYAGAAFEELNEELCNEI